MTAKPNIARASLQNAVNGILVVDKPKDHTSFDVIARLRGILGQRKLGHGGTLDPMATGVLPVFAGSATRAAALLPNEEKCYTATVKLGLKTDTGDITGRVESVSDVRCSQETLSAALKGFTGRSRQIPPMYSAVRVGGKRLYEIARQGREIEREPRWIEVYAIHITHFDGECFTLTVRCSKGTYIRTLAEDIAASAGCLATLAALRRTESAGFFESQARSLEDIERLRDAGRLDEVLLPIDGAFSAYEALRLEGDLARLFLNGVVFDRRRVAVSHALEATYRVYGPQGFLGLGEILNGSVKKIRQFYFSDEQS